MRNALTALIFVYIAFVLFAHLDDHSSVRGAFCAAAANYRGAGLYLRQSQATPYYKIPFREFLRDDNVQPPATLKPGSGAVRYIPETGNYVFEHYEAKEEDAEAPYKSVVIRRIKL